ncbi:toprim domain-containing protein, partial [Candidatus Pacearchaeota archaeon]|nr:toprim domain-containing protein [Candidatus Pacearchaeota archaeon]
MILPFRKGDEVSSIKYLHIELDRHGKKQTLVEPGCKPSLFGWKTIKSSDRAAVICEGEIDAMSLFQYGYPALSVPFGGGKGDKQQWVEYEWENLEQLETIYVCMDNDEEGEIATAELIERLGRHRCKIVTLPHKDANKCLQEGMTKEEIDICFVEAKSLDPVELKRASSFEDRTVERFYPPDGEVPGVLFPFPKLKNKLRARGGEVSMWTGINGHGKALGINTPILTETGWKVMQEIQAGDIVFDENGVRCNVIAVTDILRSRPCYKITFSDFSEIICDENHEWLTWTAKARQSHRNAKKNNRVNERQLKKKGFDQTYKRTFPSVVTAKHIAETVDIKEGCWEGKKEHSVKVAGPLSLPKQDLLIDPYLLGAWLGDGNSNDAGMTSADPQIIEYFKKDYDVTKRAAKYLYGINNGFLIHLRELNLLKNKHIPKQYLFGSDYQRLALLQGLMDTDGHIHDYGRCEFTSVKKGLADQTLFLVKSLGFQARMCTGRATINGKDCGEKYRITFTPDRQVFRLERKVKFVKLQISDRAKHRFIVSCKKIQSVPVKCIQVDSPSKLYLAGESLIPTHNSTLLGQCLMHFAYQGERVCVASLEMKPEATLGRIARQLTNERLPSREKLKKAFQWLHDKFWIFDVVGVVDADKVLEVFKYAYHRYGVTQFVIDSFMRCNIDEEDKKAQLDFMNKIVAFVNQYGGHIHIVAHPRKGLNEEHFVGKMDVKGSGCLTDLPWNVFSIWRNKAKEKALGGESFGAPKKKTDPRDEPD